MAANERSRVDAGWPVLFAFQCPWPRATHRERLGSNVNVRPAIWFLILLAAGWLLFKLFAPLLSDRESRGGYAIRIINNLHQIDLAKEMWARDHIATGSVQVSAQDLGPYLSPRRGTNELVTPVVGERYVINPTGVEPQAQLTHSVGRWPSGAVIRLYGQPTILLPKQGGANGRQPPLSDTNRAPAVAAPHRSP
jgi:hypothetical protein